jgi:hypothetical protein
MSLPDLHDDPVAQWSPIGVWSVGELTRTSFAFSLYLVLPLSWRPRAISRSSAVAFASSAPFLLITIVGTRVVREVIDLPEEQKAGLVCIREEITKQLEYKPSQLYMLHLVRPVYASPTRAHAPIVAALPPQVIPQAGVGPGFITHVLVAKYCECRYRHSTYYAAVQTMQINSVGSSKNKGFTSVYRASSSA